MLDFLISMCEIRDYPERGPIMSDIVIGFAFDNENPILQYLGFAKCARIAFGLLRCLPQFVRETSACIGIG